MAPKPNDRESVSEPLVPRMLELKVMLSRLPRCRPANRTGKVPWGGLVRTQSIATARSPKRVVSLRGGLSR